MALTIKSKAFENGSQIPQVYTCDGRDISPELSWDGAPEKTASFVLIMDDPDAPMGTWDHWILFNIPPETKMLEENIQSLPAGTVSGNNSWKRTGYGGPCPPDKEHRYFFKLFALDCTLDLKEGATKAEVEKAMEGHILEKAQLMGRYNRPKNR